ncbi:hypothetical protein SBA6_990006 [Candidatus Sulfopaludibacter sp. SbA6]|nr:hypothetical protein SBA6_990006 [Candidatus Sulfopaludibacter sp. SbA6]
MSLFAGSQADIQHHDRGCMNATLELIARLEMVEFVDILLSHHPHGPLLDLRIGQLDWALDVLQFQQPVYKGLQAPDGRCWS